MLVITIRVLYRHLNDSDITRALVAGGKVSQKDLNSNLGKAGQFLRGTTTEDLKGLITEALSQSNAVNGFPSEKGSFVANVDFGRIIDTTSLAMGATPTSVVRIVVRGNGTLASIHAY